MDENSSSSSSSHGSPPSAAPREPPRPATRPPAPPISPSFENHAFQPDETDCAPRHDHNIALNGDTQNGEPKHLSQNGAEPNHLHQNGDTKNSTKMGDPNHNGNLLNNESFGINNGKVDTPVDVNEKSAYEAVNLELVNIAPKNGGMNKDNMLPAKKDVKVDISTNSYDEYFVPVNQHRKFMRGEKLYVTADKRKRGGCQRPMTWTLGLVLLVAAILIITLAATGVIFKTPATPVNGTETDETTPMSPFNLPSHANRTLTNGTQTRHSMHNIDAFMDSTSTMPPSDNGYLENTSARNVEASPEPSSEPEPETNRNIIETLAEPTKTEPKPEPRSEPSPEPTSEPSPEPTSEPSPEPTVNESSPEPAVNESAPEPTSEPSPEPAVNESSPEPTSEPSPEPAVNESSPEPTSEPSPEPAVNESSPEPTSEPSPEPAVNESSPEPAVNESSPEPTSEPEPATNVHSSEPVSEPSSEPVAPQYVPVAVSEPIAEPTTTAAPEEAKSELTSEPSLKEVVPEASSEPTSEPSPSETSPEAQPELSPELGTSLEMVPGSSAEPTSEPVAQETTPEVSSAPSAEPAADNSLNVVETVNPTITTEEPKFSSIMNEEASPMTTTRQPDQTDVVREDKQLDHSILVVESVEATTRASEMVTETVPTSQSSADENQVNSVVPLSPEDSGNADQDLIAMTTTASPSPAIMTTPGEPSVSSVLVDGSQTIHMADSNALDVENETKPPTEEEPMKTTTQMPSPATEGSHLLFPNLPVSSETEPPQQHQPLTSTSESPPQQPMTSTLESSMNMAPASEVTTGSSNVVSDIRETTMENKLDTATNSEMTNDINNMTDQEISTQGPIMLTDILHQYEVTEPSEEPSMPHEGSTTVALQIPAIAETSSLETPVSEDNTDSVARTGSEMEMGRGFNSYDYPQIIMETSTLSEPKDDISIIIPILLPNQEETTVADISPMTEMENSITMRIDATGPEVEYEYHQTEIGDVAMTTTEEGNEIITMAPEVTKMETKENNIPELKTTIPPTSTSTESIPDMASSGIIISEVNNVNETEISPSANPTTTTEKAVDQQVMEPTVQPIVASSTDETVSVTDNEVSPSNMGSTPASVIEEKTVIITSAPSTLPETTTQSVEEAIKQFNDVISAEITKSNEAVQPMNKTTSDGNTVSPLIDMLTQNETVEMLPNDVNTEMPTIVEEDLKLLPVVTTTGMNEITAASSTVADMQVTKEETTTQSVTTPKAEPPMASTGMTVQNETSTMSNEMLNREFGDPIFDIIAHLTTTSQPSTTSETPIEITPSSTEAKSEEPSTETMEQAERDAKETLKENQRTATSMQQQTEITSEMPIELVSSPEMVSSTEVPSQATSKDVIERTTVINEEPKSSQDTDATTVTVAVNETSSEHLTTNEMNTEVPFKTMETEMDKELNTEVPESIEMSEVTSEDDDMSSSDTDELLRITTAKAMVSASIETFQTETSTESQTIAFDGSKDLVANTPDVTFKIANFSCQSATPDPLPLISKLEGLLTKALISDVGEDNEENKVVRVTDLRPGGIVTYSIQWTPKPGTNTIFNTIPQADLTELNDYLRTNNRLLGDFLVPEDARETTKYDFSTCQDDNLTGNDIFEDSLSLFPGSKEEASPLKI